jgi:hypothetical protein
VSSRGPRIAAPAVIEALAASAVGLVLAVFFTWPAVRHPASTVPGDLGDPLYQLWQLAWGGQALLHHPLHVWDANILYPLRDTLAFSDSLLGYAPLGWFGHGVGAALIRYNVAYLLAYTLAFAGAYVLARQLGCGRWGAAFAGVCFAYAPWRFAHNGHLNILSSGGIPLALACLARGYGYGGDRTPRPGWAFAGWLVAAWQLTLGFGLGLQFAYLLGVVVLVAAVRWLVAGRPAVPRRLVLASAGGLAVFLLVAGLVGVPYVQAVRDHPEARRTQADVQLFSPPARGFLVAPAESRLWGESGAAARKSMAAPVEQSLFPGATVLVLAAIGLVAGCWRVGRRVVIGIGTVVAGLFALGTSVAHGSFTYLLLFEHAPGWQGVRTPGRIVTIVTLGLCLLAATAIDRLLALLRHPRLGAVFGAALVALALAEGLNTVGNPAPGPEPSAWHDARGPLLALPSDYFDDYLAMLWSTDGLPQIVNGTAGFMPTESSRLRDAAAGFPDAPSVATLRSVGVRTVLLDTLRAPGTPWQDAAAKPLDGLGIERRIVGTTIVFDLTPSS